LKRATSKQERLPPLNKRFEFIDEAAKAPGDQAILRGAVFAVFDRQAEVERGLRIWRKTGTSIDADLRELWLHELRQVRRIMASAGASDVIVELIEPVEDDHEFAVVLTESGQPLSLLKSKVDSTHWLRNLRAATSRALLWSNVRRLAQGLGLVHGQGLVHGTLSADTVMTRGSREPDFRMTGFEWSMWFAAPPDAKSHPDTPNASLFRQQSYSFAADWRALGELTASLLGVGLLPNGTVKVSKASENIDLSAPEVMLLRKLVHPGVAEVLDAPSVISSIDDIISDILRAGAVRSGTFLVLIAEASGLPQAVAKATDGAIGLDERKRQLEWATADVAIGATLLVLPRSQTGADRFKLVTANMAYELKPLPELGGETSWAVALCESASPREDDHARGGRGIPHELTQQVTFLASRREAVESRARLGQAILDWSVFNGSPIEIQDNTTLVRLGLIFVQAVEAFTVAMEILPVELVHLTREEGRRVATLRAREDERDIIAHEIGLAKTASALRRLFADDGRQGDGSWLVGPSAALDGARSAVVATFLDISDAKGASGYRFELDDELPTGTRLYLRSKKEQGSGSAIQRRLRNIAAIADQPAIADMLDNPWLIRQAGRDTLVEDNRYKKLDSSKQAALRSIWSTLPIFAVIGPPGVGKTYLAQEVVTRKFEDERATRILLTAQGHQALNHLQEEVSKALAKNGRPDILIVRTTAPRRPGDDNIEEGDGSEIDATRAQVAETLRALSESNVARSFPPPFRARLAHSATSATTDDHDPEMRRAYRAAADLLLDAADIVVSTTNSAAIGRMVTERANFDIVIFEEAAKATGPELVGALSLSGRHLLIGDDRQLPPFDANRMEKIFSSEAVLRTIIESAPDVVGGWFRGEELSDLRQAAADPAFFGKLVEVARRMVQPFKSLVERDAVRAKAGSSSGRLSAILTKQRRMHPAIREIVSKAFYGGTLTDADMERVTPKFRCLAPLPTSPVVIVDFEHVSKTGLAEPAEFRLRGFYNPKEVETVMDVLRLLEATEEVDSPSVAVLSPYSEQVRRLRARFNEERAAGRLPNFDRFRPVREAVGFVGTVDSFQGSEADIVIVSIVRNNPMTGRSGLGFLSDPRRMNVLLSRAKSKLVIVGSLRFLKEAVRGVNPAGESEHLSFLNMVTDVINELEKQKSEDGTPLATKLPPSSLAFRT
jgi:AAA domain